MKDTPQLKVYSPSMQSELEKFFEDCFTALGWDYEPQGRHADIPATTEIYMRDGCMSYRGIRVKDMGGCFLKLRCGTLKIKTIKKSGWTHGQTGRHPGI